MKKLIALIMVILVIAVAGIGFMVINNISNNNVTEGLFKDNVIVRTKDNKYYLNR